MEYVDSLYGPINISEPVILDLIHTSSLQRLKGVDQAGFPLPFCPDDTTISRFDHSIGVYILLKNFGASLEEQIAGLIHDASHSAFSHCLDYISSHESQQTHSSQDDIHETFITSSEIPLVLQKYGIDISFILNDHNFPLKEQSLPDLCADRIDYSLRGAIASNLCTAEEARSLVRAFLPSKSKWIFRLLCEGIQFAEVFASLNTHRWAAFTSATMFYTVGSVLRHALNKKYISYNELFSTDKTVLDFILSHTTHDSHLQKLINRMYNKTTCSDNPAHYEALVYCKSRIVDPLCLHRGYIDRLSSFHSPWKDRVANESTPVSYFLSWED